MQTNLDIDLPIISVALPDWVPRAARYYLAHTEHGQPIRALARAAGCHASTILRQIRKVELRRDDPLVDAALRQLGQIHPIQTAQDNVKKSAHRPEERAQQMNMVSRNTIPDEQTMARESMRILRRLSESGAVLAVGAGLDKGVVVRDLPGGSNTRTAVVDAPIAQAMALKDWIAPRNSGRIIRYQITSAGRTALADFLRRFDQRGTAHRSAETENGCREELDQTARSRGTLGESPLSGLARRKNKDGSAFLAEPLVHAAERLREDFELAQMDPSISQNWDHFLTPGTQATGHRGDSGHGAPAQARKRVQAALEDMGPGLAEVALRCCCYLEGLETTEKRLGWSARSGKIVLRIALMRLKRHYDETLGPGGGMIG